MKKTLVKSKIVLEEDGTSLNIYFWKRTSLFSGYWYIYGSMASTGKISEEKINRINDEEVSKLFYEKFIRGFN